MREPGFDGPGIALEVWAVPSWVKGFVCEPAGIAGATDITAYRGWTTYLADASRMESVPPE